MQFTLVHCPILIEWGWGCQAGQGLVDDNDDGDDDDNDDDDDDDIDDNDVIMMPLPLLANNTVVIHGGFDSTNVRYTANALN